MDEDHLERLKGIYDRSTRFGHLSLLAGFPAYLWPFDSHLSRVPNLVGHDKITSPMIPITRIAPTQTPALKMSPATSHPARPRNNQNDE